MGALSATNTEICLISRKGGVQVTWVDNARQTFEQAMEQFKGKRFSCTLCGIEGEYDKDLDPCLTRIGQWGVLQGNTYTASIETTFQCKDRDACQQRQESKGTKQ